MKRELSFLLVSLSLSASSAFATVYDTLPKGVNMFVLKQVMTSKIESKYNSNNQEDTLSLKENFSSSKLENISSSLNTYFKELKAISPDAYNQFSLGEFQAEASAEVSAQGLAIAHGITDRLTVYGTVPFYHIKTSVDFRQTKKSNIAAIAASIKNSPTTTATSTFVKQLTLQLPETNEELLQSFVVNYYGYKPLGTWEKDALGDTEIGGIYRLTDLDDKGLTIAGGLVLPTGDADDPDSLQDVSTGDGQYDTFLESMAGISFYNSAFQLDLKTRFTYQFASKKTMRTTDDKDLPLSKYKEKMTEKLGDKIDSTLTATYNFSSTINLNSSFIYNRTGSSDYQASDPKVKSVLDSNTLVINQWVRVGIGFSSIEMYKSKKMEIPFELNLSAQKLINAKNTANYSRFDLDFRLYF
ncbi:MAG: hypothetical protein Q7U04_17740 [Bacteriovorax sp.]|nr:hypothetical protein [Bacteriovorax sp.]